MGREFFKDDCCRSEYILPDNYLGVGRPKTLKVNFSGEHLDGSVRGDLLVGTLERVLVLGMLSVEDKLDTCLVQFLDLQNVEGETLYGTMSVKHMGISSVTVERNTHRVPVESICKVGSITTIEILDISQDIIFNKGKSVEVAFICSRANVMKNVRNRVNELELGDELIGVVKARAHQWGFKVDVGGGYYIILDEKKCQKFNLRKNGVFEGALVTLVKDINLLGAVEYSVSEEPWHTWCQITHRSRVEGIISRADSEGSVYCYVPNCGFVYISGISRAQSGKNIGFTTASDSYNSYDGVKSEDTLDSYEVGDHVLLEVVQSGENTVCGYIIKKLKSRITCAIC